MFNVALGIKFNTNASVYYSLLFKGPTLTKTEEYTLFHVNSYVLIILINFDCDLNLRRVFSFSNFLSFWQIRKYLN